MQTRSQWFSTFTFLCTLVIIVKASSSPEETKKVSDETSLPLELLPPRLDAEQVFDKVFPRISVKEKDSISDTLINVDNVENREQTVEAGGLTFKIPSYASGITEIRKPLTELVPPPVINLIPVAKNLLPPYEIPISQNAITDDIPEPVMILLPPFVQLHEAMKFKPDENENNDQEFTTTILDESTEAIQLEAFESVNSKDKAKNMEKKMSSNIFVPPQVARTGEFIDHKPMNRFDIMGTDNSISPLILTLLPPPINNDNEVIKNENDDDTATLSATTQLTTDNIVKFTGKFGGSPGILGGKNDPEYERKTLITSTSTSSTSTPLLPTLIEKQDYSRIGSRYAGKFGGPPGILKPYDSDSNKEKL